MQVLANSPVIRALPSPCYVNKGKTRNNAGRSRYTWTADVANLRQQNSPCIVHFSVLLLGNVSLATIMWGHKKYWGFLVVTISKRS